MQIGLQASRKRFPFGLGGLSGRLLRRSASLAAVLCFWLSSPELRASEDEEASVESILGEFFVRGDAPEALTPIAILPSLAPDLEDVMVRTVVRRDLQISGLFDVIPDEAAPDGLYGFDDPVDVRAWRKLGAQVIVKVAARRHEPGRVKLFGLCYFPRYGKQPVYEKTLVVGEQEVRATAHRITDGLLGAITGRNGSFSSRLTFSARVGRNSSIFTIDADGHGIRRRSDPSETSIAPLFGPGGSLLFARSRKYSPFRLVAAAGPAPKELPFKTSIYSASFDDDHQRLAVAVADATGSSVHLGLADGSGMKKVSTTEVATHPAFGPTGSLAWVGGGGERSARRVYVDGKAVSPAGVSASAPTFCDTEDGVRLVYAVALGNDRYDLVMSNASGGNLVRITQGEGSNSYPACSPDGRLLAFFSERASGDGLYVRSLVSGRTEKLSGKLGTSLRWAALPE